MSKILFKPADMYHLPPFPFQMVVSKLLTIDSGAGSGHSPSSCFWGTHLFWLTAQLLNLPTTSFSNKSPHLIWQAASSARLLQVLRHTTLARHFGFSMHSANSFWQDCSRHLPIYILKDKKKKNTEINGRIWVLRKCAQYDSHLIFYLNSVGSVYGVWCPWHRPCKNS